MKRYPGLDGDDLLSLSAMASYVPAPSFEEAFSALSGGSPRDSAEKAYADCQAYYAKHPTRLPEGD